MRQNRPSDKNVSSSPSFTPFATRTRNIISSDNATNNNVHNLTFKKLNAIIKLETMF